jgi:hypothetical protein
MQVQRHCELLVNWILFVDLFIACFSVQFQCAGVQLIDVKVKGFRAAKRGKFIYSLTFDKAAKQQKSIRRTNARDQR